MIEISGYKFTVNRKALFPAFSPDSKINLTKEVALKALKEHNCYFLRYISDFDLNSETSFWYIIKEQHLPIEEYSRNTRNQIKKGLKSCEVKKVDYQTYLSTCYPVYKNAMLGYDEVPVPEERFKDLHEPSPNRDYWIVYSSETNEPIAYSTNILEGNSCNYTFIKYDPSFQKLYPSYALHFEMDKYYLEEQKLSFVNMGARNILHETGVQNFVISKFKYRRAYCRLNIIYQPLFGLMVKTVFPFRKLIYKLKNTGLNTILKQHELAR